MKRPTVVLLVGAGGLSLLGSAPGDLLNLVPDGSSGPIGMTLLEQRNTGSGCRVGVRLSRPVMRATLRDEQGVLGGLTCVDGSDCLLEIRFPPDSACSGGQAPTVPATSAADAAPLAVDAADAARDVVIADANGADATAVVRDANPEVNRPDAQPTPDASLPAPTAPTDGGAGGTCWNRAVPAALLRFEGQFESQRCSKDGKRFQMKVETKDGTVSTLDYHVEVESPSGCGS